MYVMKTNKRHCCDNHRKDQSSAVHLFYSANSCINRELALTMRSRAFRLFGFSSPWRNVLFRTLSPPTKLHIGRKYLSLRSAEKFIFSYVVCNVEIRSILVLSKFLSVKMDIWIKVLPEPWFGSQRKKIKKFNHVRSLQSVAEADFHFHALGQNYRKILEIWSLSIKAVYMNVLDDSRCG